MEYPILIIILAIATVFLTGFSTAEAMEEKMEFELPESGKVLNFGDSVPVRSSGGLDPPAGELSPGAYGVRIAAHFEMAESGILIDFNRLKADLSAFGFSQALPSDASLPGNTTAATPALKAFEMPESGHLVVFPHQVELRREQAARMRPLEAVISDKR